MAFWSDLDLTRSDSKLHSLSSDCWSQPLEDIGTSEALSSGILELDDKVLEIKEAEIELKLFELEDIVSLKERPLLSTINQDKRSDHQVW